MQAVFYAVQSNLQKMRPVTFAKRSHADLRRQDAAFRRLRQGAFVGQSASDCFPPAVFM